MASSTGRRAAPDVIDTDTFALRLLRYERSQKLCNYLGGGIGGILVVVGLSSNAITNAPWQLVSTLITVAVVSAICLGRAYIGFLSAQYELVRHQKQSNIADTAIIPGDEKFQYSTANHVFFVVSALLLMVAGVLLIIGLWIPPNASGAEQTPPVAPVAPVVTLTPSVTTVPPVTPTP